MQRDPRSVQLRINNFTALQIFKSKYDGTRIFRDCGLFVDLNRNYLAASPDSICCCKNEIIQIKCPFSIRFQDPSKANCLENTRQLLRTHEYFYLQFQLHRTMAKICHFVVYTTQGIHSCTIQYDTDFVDSLLPSLDKFYEEVFCVEYCKRFGFNY